MSVVLSPKKLKPKIRERGTTFLKLDNEQRQEYHATNVAKVMKIGEDHNKIKNYNLRYRCSALF